MELEHEFYGTGAFESIYGSSLEPAGGDAANNTGNKVIGQIRKGEKKSIEGDLGVEEVLESVFADLSAVLEVSDAVAWGKFFEFLTGNPRLVPYPAPGITDGHEFEGGFLVENLGHGSAEAAGSQNGHPSNGGGLGGGLLSLRERGRGAGGHGVVHRDGDRRR
jgi:hypothetical protein